MLNISRIASVRLAYLPERVNTLHRANSFAWYPFYHIKPESPSRSEYLSAFTRHFASATNHLRKPQSSSRYYPQDAQLSHRYTVHDRVIQHVRITITTILILTTHFFLFSSLSHAWQCQYRFIATHKNNQDLMDGCTTAANLQFSLGGEKSVLFQIAGKHPATCIDTSCINGGFDRLVDYCKTQCSAAGSEFVTVADCVNPKPCGTFK